MNDLTPNQEKFANLIAIGMSQAAAYREAYDAKKSSPETVWSEASRLASNPKVAARVEELRAPVVEGTRYALKDAMEEARKAYELAAMLGNAASMVAATQLRAKLNGLMVEDRKNQRRPMEELSDAELDQIIQRNATLQ